MALAVAVCFAIAMFETASLGNLLSKRIVELFDTQATWTRRMWRYGTMAQLNEFLALAATGASTGAREFSLAATNRAVSRDPAIHGMRRGTILNFLPKKNNLDRFVKNSHSFHLLSEEIESLNSEYLSLWIEAIERAGEDSAPMLSSIDVELAATLLAGHLQSVGFSNKWILNHFTYELKRKESTSSILASLRVTDRLIRQGPGEFTFLLPLDRSMHINSSAKAPWLSRADFAARFLELQPDYVVPDNYGGLEIHVQALEKYSAQERASRFLLQVAGRVRSSSQKRKLVHGWTAWMQPGGVEVDLSPKGREGLHIPSLDRDGGQQIFQPLQRDVEAALDLLEGFELGSERNACISAWAAIESLLADSSDFGNLVEVADRAAAILTCCYVQEEFRGLSVAHARAAEDSLAEALRSAPLDRRIALLEEHLGAGGTLNTGDGLGLLVATRVKQMIPDRQALNNLRADISAALRRLYYARNQIAHAGAVELYGFNMILASMRPLVSALLDKLINSAQDSPMSASLLAAKAHWALEHVCAGEDLSMLAIV